MRVSRTNVTIPRAVSTVTVRPAADANTTVTTLRLDGRIVRHDPNGVTGVQRLDADPATETTLRAETRGDRTGSLVLRYRRLVGTPSTLEVRVDA
jgi:hypothetical protein